MHHDPAASSGGVMQIRPFEDSDERQVIAR
jgi:hypothetical protein